jgi:hypothetical protein
LNGERTVTAHTRISLESLAKACFSRGQAERYASHARHEVVIAVGRSTVAVRFSRFSAAQAFAARFGDMLENRPPDAIIHAVALDNEAYFWLSPDRVSRWSGNLSDELLVFFADNVAMHEYLRTSRDLGIHAAAIARGPHVYALVGQSTAGKTTTAIAAVRNGFGLYSDERCIVQNGRVVPFLRAITVREGGRTALLEENVPDCAVNTRLKELPSHGDSTIRPRRLVGERAGGPPLPLRGIFIIEGRDATPAVEVCPIYSALPVLLRSVISRDRGMERVVRLLAEVREVPIHLLRLGRPGATAALIERTLDEAFSDARR